MIVLVLGLVALAIFVAGELDARAHRRAARRALRAELAAQIRTLRGDEPTKG